ncbi:MAG TPA: hypothetical protein VM492_04870 [Sumerlaeia bacterium]|nr:hypothetical protein [Sumerlaeia bacterium]
MIERQSTSQNRTPDGHNATHELADEELLDLQHRWLKAVWSAMVVFQLYPPGHPKAEEDLQVLCRLTQDLQEGHDGEISLSCSEQTVLVNHFPVDPNVVAFRRIGDELRQRNIHTIIFSSGIDEEELSAFMALFSDPPRVTIEKGGLGLLLKESGIQHVRLARLKYAPSVKSTSAEDSETGEERVLFARMEECLKDLSEGEQGQGEWPPSVLRKKDRSMELVAFLENPKTTARFLERKRSSADPDPEFAREVVATLERAGTLVYSRQPDKWNRSKKNIAEALTLLNPSLREKTLEIISEEESDSVFLEEMVGALEPEQIALILADHLGRMRPSASPAPAASEGPGAEVAGASVPASGEPASSPSGDPAYGEETSSLVQLLVRNPEHFQVLQPMLLQEFSRRGMRAEDYLNVFGPLCGEYFARTRGDRLSPIGSDKALMYQYSEAASPTDTSDLGDLLKTLDEEKWERALPSILEEVLAVETAPRVYREVIGPQLATQALNRLKAGDIEECRENLRLLVHHAAHPETDAFPQRHQAAQDLLAQMPPADLVDVFWADNEADGVGETRSQTETALELLLSTGLGGVSLELLRRLFDPEADAAKRNSLLPAVAARISVLGPQVREWLLEGHDRRNRHLWFVLEEGLCEACLSALTILLADADPDVFSRAIHLLGKVGGRDAEYVLFSKVQGKGPQAELAEEELRRLRSPLAASLIEARLDVRDVIGLRHRFRMGQVRLLCQLDTPSSRRILDRFMTRPCSLWQRGSHRLLVLEAMRTLPRWPREEADKALRRLVEHKDRRIAREARKMRSSLTTTAKQPDESARP